MLWQLVFSDHVLGFSLRVGELCWGAGIQNPRFSRPERDVLPLERHPSRCSSESFRGLGVGLSRLSAKHRSNPVAVRTDQVALRNLF